jgi:hypothetical protein
MLLLCKCSGTSLRLGVLVFWILLIIVEYFVHSSLFVVGYTYQEGHLALAPPLAGWLARHSYGGGSLE